MKIDGKVISVTVAPLPGSVSVASNAWTGSDRNSIEHILVIYAVTEKGGLWQKTMISKAKTYQSDKSVLEADDWEMQNYV